MGQALVHLDRAQRQRLLSEAINQSTSLALEGLARGVQHLEDDERKMLIAASKERWRRQADSLPIRALAAGLRDLSKEHREEILSFAMIEDEDLRAVVLKAAAASVAYLDEPLQRALEEQVLTIGNKSSRLAASVALRSALLDGKSAGVRGSTSAGLG
jgi:hypothetical protein